MTKNSVIVSIDAMGGDNAPECIIEGLLYGLPRYENVQFLLFGDKNLIQPKIEQYNQLCEICKIVHAPDAISMDDKPTQALRHGRSSSMWQAIEAVESGKANIVLSSGNTGALMAMAKYQLRTLPEIDRPAIAAVWPTVCGETIVLDMGANVSADAGQLSDFAIMGAEFARILFNTQKPTIGLLNVGTEMRKGHETVRSASQTLETMETERFTYHGFVEGNDIARGVVDVVVTDGFTGNIALKTAEGTARLIGDYLKNALQRSITARIGAMFLAPALKVFKNRIDPRRVNGGVFLGLNAPVVKSHGSSDAISFSAAVDLAIDLARGQVADVIKQQLCRETFGDPSPEALDLVEEVTEQPMLLTTDGHIDKPTNTEELAQQDEISTTKQATADNKVE